MTVVDVIHRHLDLGKPRVRPEAQGFYKQGQGTVGMVLQIEGQRVPSGYRRTGNTTVTLS